MSYPIVKSYINGKEVYRIYDEKKQEMIIIEQDEYTNSKDNGDQAEPEQSEND